MRHHPNARSRQPQSAAHAATTRRTADHAAARTELAPIRMPNDGPRDRDRTRLQEAPKENFLELTVRSRSQKAPSHGAELGSFIRSCIGFSKSAAFAAAIAATSTPIADRQCPSDSDRPPGIALGTRRRIAARKERLVLPPEQQSQRNQHRRLTSELRNHQQKRLIRESAAFINQAHNQQDSNKCGNVQVPGTTASPSMSRTCSVPRVVHHASRSISAAASSGTMIS